MSRLIVVLWPKGCDGSRFTLHETPTASKRDVMFSIDTLGEPTNTKHVFIKDEEAEWLTEEETELLSEEGYLDYKELEKPLKEIWENKHKKKEITSRYIKIIHPVYGCIDQHRAIMQDHLGRKLGRKEVVHHINGNTHDNRIENLEVMSLSEHSRMHMLAKPNRRVFTDEQRATNGLKHRGELSSQSKLNREKIEWAKKNEEGLSLKDRALRLGVHPSTLSKAIGGISYKA